MKTAGFIIKLISTGLLIALGITVFILGVSSNTGSYYSWGYDYEYVPYNYYGGDAYTGIQNAAADAANNATEVGHAVSSFQNSVSNQMENIYVWSGVALVIVGVYLLGCTFASKEPKAVGAPKNEMDNFQHQ